MDVFLLAVLHVFLFAVMPTVIVIIVLLYVVEGCMLICESRHVNRAPGKTRYLKRRKSSS